MSGATGPLARSEPRPPEELEAERVLVERAQAGDRQALGAILRQYGPLAFRSVLLPRLGSREAAEEALGVLYERVIERIGQFQWQGRGIYPWLRTVAFHIAMDALRAKKRELLFEPEDLERTIDDASRNAEDRGDPRLVAREDQEEAREKLERALEKLHHRYKVAIRLRVLEERPREEVARELGVSVATFDVVLHRAMNALRKELGAASEAGRR
jgi:RNA polymerase sigma factor (sigma-70 family)